MLLRFQIYNQFLHVFQWELILEKLDSMHTRVERMSESIDNRFEVIDKRCRDLESHSERDSL